MAQLGAFWLGICHKTAVKASARAAVVSKGGRLQVVMAVDQIHQFFVMGSLLRASRYGSILPTTCSFQERERKTGWKPQSLCNRILVGHPP